MIIKHSLLKWNFFVNCFD